MSSHLNRSYSRSLFARRAHTITFYLLLKTTWGSLSPKVYGIIFHRSAWFSAEMCSHQVYNNLLPIYLYFLHSYERQNPSSSKSGQFWLLLRTMIRAIGNLKWKIWSCQRPLDFMTFLLSFYYNYTHTLDKKKRDSFFNVLNSLIDRQSVCLLYSCLFERKRMRGTGKMSF